MASDGPRSAGAVAVTLAVCALVFASTARAGPTAADRETARSLMQEGRTLRDKGDLKGALDRFRGANAIMHVPTTALEVAKMQVAVGLLVEARDTIAAIRQAPERPDDPAPFKEARAKLLQLDAGLEGRVPSITIAVHGAAEGDVPEVAIDGVKIPAAAAKLPRRVDPGHHVVTAKGSSGEGQQEVDVKEGQSASADITLASSGASAAPVPAPAPTDAAAPEAEAPPSTLSHGPYVLTWVGVGLAGAGLVAGTVTGALVLSKTSSLHSQCPDHVCPTSSSGSLDSAGTLATVSTISFVASAAGAGLAVFSLVIGHDVAPAQAEQGPPAPASGVRVTPWIGLGRAGLRGVF